MMRRKIYRAPIVDQDLEQISTYIAEHNFIAASRFLENVEKSFQRLADLPGLGAKWEEFETPFADLRYWPMPRYRNYVIFYRPVADGVQIIRVANGRRDFRSLFS